MLRNLHSIVSLGFNSLLCILYFTALFTNMRILNFKSQLTVAFFAAVNHLNGPLRKQNFILTGSKGLDPFCEFLCFKVRCL